jgi:hypothetical protein
MLNAKKNEFVKQEIIREQKENNNPNKTFVMPVLTRYPQL